MMCERCPTCGTNGKTWEEEHDVFLCPMCLSIYSEFGLVVEPQKRQPDFWN